MKSMIETIFMICCIGVIAVMGWEHFLRKDEVPTTRIQTNTVVQYKTGHPITLTKYITNQEIITNTVIVYITSNLNRFLQDPGWIAISNKPPRIWAGLFTRSWFMDITVKPEKKKRHDAGLLLGTGIGAYYGYRLHKDLRVRAMIFARDNKVGFLVGGGLDF